MGYLLLTILFSSMVSVVLRFSGQKVKDDFAMLAVNDLICGVISALSAGEKVPEAQGMLSESVVIPSPHPDIIKSLY